MSEKMLCLTLEQAKVVNSLFSATIKELNKEIDIEYSKNSEQFVRLLRRKYEIEVLARQSAITFTKYWRTVDAKS